MVDSCRVPEYSDGFLRPPSSPLSFCATFGLTTHYMADVFWTWGNRSVEICCQDLVTFPSARFRKSRTLELSWRVLLFFLIQVLQQQRQMIARYFCRILSSTYSSSSWEARLLSQPFLESRILLGVVLATGGGKGFWPCRTVEDVCDLWGCFVGPRMRRIAGYPQLEVECFRLLKHTTWGGSCSQTKQADMGTSSRTGSGRVAKYSIFGPLMQAAFGESLPFACVSIWLGRTDGANDELTPKPPSVDHSWRTLILGAVLQGFVAVLSPLLAIIVATSLAVPGWSFGCHKDYPNREKMWEKSVKF